MASLRAAVLEGEDPAEAFRRLGRVWPEFGWRLTRVDSSEAEAGMGPAIKEHTLLFVKTPQGWKLDLWVPGQ